MMVGRILFVAALLAVAVNAQVVEPLAGEYDIN
jgi:hypothetical protein